MVGIMTDTDESWKYEKSCWVAYKIRACGSPTVYWGPFATFIELTEWADKHSLVVSAVELKDPNSDTETWWYP